MRNYLLLLFMISGWMLYAQCPFADKEYEIRTKEEILYAVDTAFDGTIDSLFLDLYTPIGDRNPSRPMIVMVHGGGFFRGSKESFRDLSKGFASQGFACATISYRLGFYRPLDGSLDYPFSYDDAEPIRAGYRAMQDVKAAVRFLKARHEEDSTDIDHFILFGASAGGIAILTAANIIYPGDKYPQCKEIEPVKTTSKSFERPDLGPVDGKFNRNGYDAKVEAVISIFGGIVRTDFLGTSYPKHYFLYHQTLDPIVPCKTDNGYWAAPVLKDNYPTISGSCAIVDYFEKHGNAGKIVMPYIDEGAEHGVKNLDLLLDSIKVFLNQVLCEPTAVNEFPETSGFRIFPTPASQFIMLRHPENIRISHVDIYDLSGMKWSPFSYSQSSRTEISIDVATLPKGIYLLKLTDKIGRTYLMKFVK